MSETMAAATPLRVLTVFGTRPEAIKLAPVVQACQEDPQIAHWLCTTGQHREMLDQVLQVFGMKPDIDLALMRPGQDLAGLTAEALLGTRQAIRDTHPDWVIVQGDTTTAFAAGLAAFYERVPVLHVEAGLRTGNLQSPWPEELNRRMLSALTTLHCAPTDWAAGNLLREGVSDAQIVVTGNTVIDALQWVSQHHAAGQALLESLGPRSSEILSAARRIVLVTGHRRENLDSGLEGMCTAIKRLAARGDVSIVFPVHLNPHVQRIVAGILSEVNHVYLTPPLDYLSFVALLRRCYLVITDSGGLQEEAPGLGKPVLVTRDTTERPEAIQAGTARLVGRDPSLLLSAAERLLDDPDAYATMARARNPFGDGQAARRIVNALRQHAGLGTSSG